MSFDRLYDLNTELLRYTAMITHWSVRFGIFLQEDAEIISRVLSKLSQLKERQLIFCS